MFRRRATTGRHAGPTGTPGRVTDPGPVPASVPASDSASAGEDQPWAAPPPGLDVSAAHPARIWNYWLGGHDWFPADRTAGDAMSSRFPQGAEAARAQRAFGFRALRFLAGAARIRQYLDVGAGLPSGGNTHEIVQRIAPDSGVVYADNDPAVLLHAKHLLESVSGSGAGNGPVSYIDADVRDVAAVLAGAAGTLDLGQPVALIMLGVLGHVEDYGAARSIVSHLMDTLPPGSYLMIADGVAPDGWPLPYQARRPDELASFFDGLSLVEPGVVPCSRWRPDGPAADSPAYCGVARKP
jgi:S-adenosyl methyltransferase